MRPAPATPAVLRTGQAPSRWPLLLTWMLCLVALLHVLLLFFVADPVDHATISIRLLQPIATAGALVVMLLAAWRELQQRRRFCWALQAASMLIIVVTSGLTIAERARGTIKALPPCCTRRLTLACCSPWARSPRGWGDEAGRCCRWCC